MKISLCLRIFSKILCKPMSKHSTFESTYHIIPHGNDTLHINITRKEGNESVRNDFCEFDEDISVISDDRLIIADFKFGAHSDLI